MWEIGAKELKHSYTRQQPRGPTNQQHKIYSNIYSTVNKKESANVRGGVQNTMYCSYDMIIDTSAAIQ